MASCVSFRSVTQWTAHVSSKQHRASFAREKEEERKRADKKRAAATAGPSDGKKRKVDGGSSAAAAAVAAPAGNLPAGFFADPAAAPPARSLTPPQVAPPAVAAPAMAPVEEVDGEFDAFLASIAAAPGTAAGDKPSNEHEVEGQTTFSSAPVLVLPPSAEELVAQQKVEEESEADRKRRLEREEREEIVARLEEEEQAQEEAFERVDRMKERLRALKKVRFLPFNGDVVPLVSADLLFSSAPSDRNARMRRRRRKGRDAGREMGCAPPFSPHSHAAVTSRSRRLRKAVRSSVPSNGQTCAVPRPFSLPLLFRLLALSVASPPPSCALLSARTAVDVGVCGRPERVQGRAPVRSRRISLRACGAAVERRVEPLVSVRQRLSTADTLCCYYF